MSTRPSFTAMSAVLAILTLSAPATAQTCPSFASPGAALTHSAQSLTDAQRVSVVAGGSVDLSACDSVPGVGHVIRTPDFTLQYDGQGLGNTLDLRVEASCDTVLLVNDAYRDWHFNDDAGSSNPGLSMTNAPNGQYDIWVGTFGLASCDAVLVLHSRP